MTVLAWILQGVLGLMFILAGFLKVTGSKMNVENFTKWGYPQWFRIVTGLVELAAAILLIVGYWYTTAGIIGAAILVAVGIGGVYTHLRIKDTFKNTALILVLGVLAIILLIILL